MPKEVMLVMCTIWNMPGLSELEGDQQDYQINHAFVWKIMSADQITDLVSKRDYYCQYIYGILGKAMHTIW